MKLLSPKLASVSRFYTQGIKQRPKHKYENRNGTQMLTTEMQNETQTGMKPKCKEQMQRNQTIEVLHGSHVAWQEQ